MRSRSRRDPPAPLSKSRFGGLASFFDPILSEQLPALELLFHDGGTTLKAASKSPALLAHTDAVFCLELVHGNEGKTHLFSGGADRCIRGWDPTGTPQSCWRGHTGCIFSLAWTGEHLASGSADKTVRLWAVNTGQTLRVLTGHPGTVLALAAVDGKLFCAGSGSAVHVWNIETGEAAHRLAGHIGSVKCLIPFPLRGGILSAGTDGLVKEWNGEGRLVSKLKAHRTSVTTCAVARDLLFTGGGESSWKVWRAADDYASHERAGFILLQTVGHHSAGVSSISWMEDATHGLRIFIAGLGGSLRMFEAGSKQLESSGDESAPSIALLVSRTGYTCSACAPNGVFVGGYDGTVSLLPFARGSA